MPSLAEAKPAQPGQVAVNPLGDGDKKEFVAEESTKETVKTIARGKPGDLRCTRGDYRVLTTNAHGLRVLRAPGFPCSLFNRGTKFTQASGRSSREKAKVRVLSINAPPHTAVMLRLVRNCALGGASRIPETPALETRSRGVLDTPLSRGMTAICFAGAPKLAETLAEGHRPQHSDHRPPGQLQHRPGHPAARSDDGADRGAGAGRADAGVAVLQAAARIFGFAERASRGSTMRTTVPTPSFERSFIDPPCRVVSERAIASPSPEPW